MRWIAWSVAALLLVIWLAVEMPPLTVPPERQEPDIWRRTSTGWERAEWLLPEPAPIPAWLHPAVLVTFQVAVCCAAWGLSAVATRKSSEFVEDSPIGEHPRG